MGIGKALDGFKSMISAASDLCENINKIKAIFGEGAASVIADSNAMAKAFGTSKNEYLDAAGKFGGLFKGAGFSGNATAALARQFVRLAADAASFFNTDFETAFTKLRSGLAGEAEPLRDFGIFLDEDKTKAYAYAHGIAALGKELTTQQKIQSRLQQITEGLSDANGDLAKTSGGVANLTRNVCGQLENLGAMIGQAFLPATQKLLGGASQVLGAIGQWAESSGIITTLGSLIDSFLITPIEFLIGLVKGANDILISFGVNLGEVFGAVAALFAGLAKSIASVLKSLTYGRKETEAIAASASVTTKFKQVVQTPKVAAKKASNEVKFAGAQQFGSREAYSSILRSKAAFTANDSQRQLAAHAKITAENSGKQLEVMKKIQEVLMGQGGGAVLATI